MNIWTWGNGTEKEKKALALREAKKRGFKHPVVVRTVPIEGTRSNLVGVIVEESGQTAAPAKRSRRRA